MYHKQFHNRSEQVKLQSPIVYAAERLRDIWTKALAAIGASFMQVITKGVQSTSTIELGKSNPLRLDLQFFAEDPPGTDNPDDPPADPPSGDDELTLADLLRTNPKIKAEYKVKVEAAVQKRFKNYDFDPDEARAALREKKEREEKGESHQATVNQEIVDLKATNQKLLDKAKALNLATYAGENGLDPKLLVRLAGQQVTALELNDSYELDSEELDEIVDDLRAEFPNLFPVAGAADDAGGTEDTPPPKKKTPLYNGGSTQQTNKPPATKTNVEEDVKETLERLKKLNRI